MSSVARVAAFYDIHANLPALEAVLEEIRRTDYPKAESFARGFILNPPSEASMLELFDRTGLK